MLMYNFLEYSDNYSVTSESLWNYYRDEVNDAANESNADRVRKNNNKAVTSKSFTHKAKILESTPDDDNTLETVVTLLNT